MAHKQYIVFSTAKILKIIENVNKMKFFFYKSSLSKIKENNYEGQDIVKNGKISPEYLVFFKIISYLCHKTSTDTLNEKSAETPPSLPIAPPAEGHRPAVHQRLGFDPC